MPFGQPFLDRVRRGEDALHLCHHVQRGLVQVGADDSAQFGEPVGIPHGSAALRDQFVGGAGDAVVEQIRDVAVRVMAERQFGLVAQARVDLFDRGRHVQQQQSPGAQPHGVPCLVLGGEHADRHAARLVHQRGIRPYRPVRSLLLHDLYERPEVPGPQALALDTVGHGADRLAHRRSQPAGERGQVLAFREGVLLLVHHPEGDLQMVGYPVELPGLPRHRHAGEAVEFAFQYGEQRSVRRGHRLQYPRGVVGRGHEVAPHLLGQRADQRGHQFRPQARHLPVEALTGDLVEQRQWDVHGHTVGIRAGLELVGQHQRKLPVLPCVGVVAFVDAVHTGFDEHGRGEREQVRPGPAGLLPPAVEMAAGDDVGRDPLVVEVEQGFVVDKDVAPACPVFEFLDVVEQSPVVVEECMVRLPVAFHQGVADEQIPAQGGVDRGIVHPAGGHQRQPVQCHLLEGDHGGPVLLPVRFTVGALHQVRRERLGPFRFDTRDGPRPQPGCLDELGGHQPARWFPEQRRPREDREPGVSRTLVLLFVGILEADAGQQAGEQRHVNVPRVTRCAVDGYSEIFHDLAQLAVDVLPLPYPQIVQKIGPAQFAELVARQLLLLFLQIFP